MVNFFEQSGFFCQGGFQFMDSLMQGVFYLPQSCYVLSTNQGLPRTPELERGSGNQQAAALLFAVGVQKGR